MFSFTILEFNNSVGTSILREEISVGARQGFEPKAYFSLNLKVLKEVVPKFSVL